MFTLQPTVTQKPAPRAARLQHVVHPWLQRHAAHLARRLASLPASTTPAPAASLPASTTPRVPQHLMACNATLAAWPVYARATPKQTPLHMPRTTPRVSRKVSVLSMALANPTHRVATGYRARLGRAPATPTKLLPAPPCGPYTGTANQLTQSLNPRVLTATVKQYAGVTFTVQAHRIWVKTQHAYKYTYSLGAPGYKRINGILLRLQQIADGALPPRQKHQRKVNRAPKTLTTLVVLPFTSVAQCAAYLQAGVACGNA